MGECTMRKRGKTAPAKLMGPVIKALREQRYPGHGGQMQCADAFHVSQSEWSRWETGSKAPAASTQRKLAVFFGITIGELWGEIPVSEIGAETAGASGPSEENLLRLHLLVADAQNRLDLFTRQASVDAVVYSRFATAMEVVRRTLDLTAVEGVETDVAGTQ